MGEASWYGPGFHGKSTANGERFDENDLTAAHPTLPMPSLVRVTNLQNGKSLIVRVNDRGPFKSSRIIDLSKRSAQTLGIKGVQKVRVQYLQQETERYLAERAVNRKELDMFAYNEGVRDGRYGEPVPAVTEPTQNVVHAPPPVAGSKTQPVVLSVDAEEWGVIREADLPPVAKQGVVAQEEPKQLVAAPEPAKQEVAALEVKAPTVNKVPVETRYVEEAPARPAPAAQMAPAAGGEYYIQAGSFGSRANADRRAESLSGIYTVITDKVVKTNREWWRVRVGPFPSHQEAAKLLRQVQGAGVPDAHVMHEK